MFKTSLGGICVGSFGLHVTGPSITSNVWESTESNGEEKPFWT